MRPRVKWNNSDPRTAPGGLSIWFQYDEPTDLDDKIDILLDVLRGAIGSSPFVVCDLVDTPSGIWLQAFAKEHACPHTVLPQPPSMIAVGAESVELLGQHRDHDESGLAWIGGLKVFVFRNITSLREQVQRWEQFDGAWPAVHSGSHEFSLETQGDAESLVICPGIVTSEELLALVERTVTSLGFTWEKAQGCG